MKQYIKIINEDMKKHINSPVSKCFSEQSIRPIYFAQDITNYKNSLFKEG
jgi:hypothetical protein